MEPTWHPVLAFLFARHLMVESVNLAGQETAVRVIVRLWISGASVAAVLWWFLHKDARRPQQ
eukprot:3937698-Rhodomonas_salina.2